MKTFKKAMKSNDINNNTNKNDTSHLYALSHLILKNPVTQVLFYSYYTDEKIET